ncbi:hypothetical protein C7M84_018142 [Penaeus vannamei]|uniref:Uncharacterized protein n=1 Tax=Penaeus vannamei TaxID=6689 RepID=A0A3R7QDC4_PENVA|nr:hypothetical protein C7M84_018142 [Penaeus vannamei]
MKQKQTPPSAHPNFPCRSLLFSFFPSSLLFPPPLFSLLPPSFLPLTLPSHSLLPLVHSACENVEFFNGSSWSLVFFFYAKVMDFARFRRRGFTGKAPHFPAKGKTNRVRDVAELSYPLSSREHGLATGSLSRSQSRNSSSEQARRSRFLAWEFRFARRAAARRPKASWRGAKSFNSVAKPCGDSLKPRKSLKRERGRGVKFVFMCPVFGGKLFLILSSSPGLLASPRQAFFLPPSPGPPLPSSFARASSSFFPSARASLFLPLIARASSSFFFARASSSFLLRGHPFLLLRPLFLPSFARASSSSLHLRQASSPFRLAQASFLPLSPGPPLPIFLLFAGPPLPPSYRQGLLFLPPSPAAFLFLPLSPGPPLPPSFARASSSSFAVLPSFARASLFLPLSPGPPPSSHSSPGPPSSSFPSPGLLLPLSPGPPLPSSFARSPSSLFPPQGLLFLLPSPWPLSSSFRQVAFLLSPQASLPSTASAAFPLILTAFLPPSSSSCL